jgi:DNA-directed RNA polymerase specialized sigma24 family protein
VPLLSLELARAEERYAAEPIDTRDPEKLYLAAWARSLVEQARARLRETYGARAALYQALEPFLDRKDAGASYREVAAQFAIPQVTARVHVSRLRKRFAELLKEEVRQTVENEADVEPEIAWLMGVLGAG